MRRLLKLGALGLAMLLGAGIVAPFIRVDQYREQIRDGLQRSLHRKVEILGETRLNLFPGPGFSVQKVVIHDDPSVGLEPLANVPELQAGVRLSSLWRGRIEFDAVRFVEPSVNLVKPDHGAWNVAQVLAGAAAQASTRLPEIRVSRGRLNLKFGDMKSAFYLTDVDMTVSPSGGGLDIRFSVAPARTDRAAQGCGLFTGRGRWDNRRIDLEVELERSPIEELVTLARGESLGMHGRISSRAKLSGPVGNAQITGRFDLEDVQRWDLIQGPAGALSMNYRGRLDFTAQRLELNADASTNPTTPLALKLVIAEFLYNPNWTAEFTINRLPAASVVEAARHMGAPLPSALKIDGNAVGVIAYGSLPGLQGHITIDDATVQLEKGPEFRMPHASVLIANDELRLLPATISGQSRDALLEAIYLPLRQHLEARLTGTRLPISDLQNGAGHLLNGASVPLVNRLKGGTWSGSLRYTSDAGERGAWNASLQIRDTTTTVAGIQGPLRLLSAELEISPERLTMRRVRALAGTVELFGDYRYTASAERPHRFTLIIPAVDAGQMEELLAPTLRRDASFLARTLRFRSSAPEWLRTRLAEGSVRIGAFTAGETVLRAIRARLVWNGTTVQLPSVSGRIDEAGFRSTATIDLRQGEPQYSVAGTVQNVAWRGGTLDLEGAADTSGTGSALLVNLRALGKYEARAVSFAPEFSFQTATGTFDLSVARTGPQVKLIVQQAMAGAERFTGEGITTPDGKLQMELASQTRVMRLAGHVTPLKLELTQEGNSR